MSSVLQLPKIVEISSKRFQSKREVATESYEAFRKLSYKPSKTPVERSFHYYPEIKSDWDKSISLYKNKKNGGREEWMGKSCGADVMYDSTTTNTSPVSGFSSSFESTSLRFHDPERSFPDSRGIQSYLKIPASTTSKDVGPGSYDVEKRPTFYTPKSSSSFASKSQRLFPSRVLDKSGPVSVQMSSPYNYDIISTKDTLGGKFSTSKRFADSDYKNEDDDDDDDDDKKKEESKVERKKKEDEKRRKDQSLLFVTTTIIDDDHDNEEEKEEEEEEEEKETNKTPTKEKNVSKHPIQTQQKKDTFPYELVTNPEGLEYLKSVWFEINNEK